MKKWEYLVEDINQVNGATTNNEVEEQRMLDDFGSDGWELVAIVPILNEYFRRAYFKRRAD